MQQWLVDSSLRRQARCHAGFSEWNLILSMMTGRFIAERSEAKGHTIQSFESEDDVQH